MAFSAGMSWDVRTTGDDSNGGGFNVNASGTDYSQQNSPQFTYTDLVIDAVTNTKVTSAAFPFNSLSPGNVINVTGGTGFTLGRFEVLSVAGNVATLDRAVGTLGSTGGNGKLGGSLATIGATTTYMTNATGGMYTYIQSGTYTLTSKITIAYVGGQVPLTYVGYQTTHGDFGTKPLITTATNGTPLFDTGVWSGALLSFINISFSNTAGTRSYGIISGQYYTQLFMYRCVMDGFLDAIQGSSGISGYSIRLYLWNTEIKNSTRNAIDISNQLNVVQSYIHNSTGIGVQQDGSEIGSITNSIITANGSYGVNWVSTNMYTSVQGSTIANNTGDGIRLAGTNGVGWGLIKVVNTIIYGNSGYGINQTSSTAGASQAVGPNYAINCAFGSNSSGNLSTNMSNVTQNLNPVTLTADPFTNAAGGDFSLNSTAGGGAACRSAGAPGAFPGGSTTGYMDIGAAQAAAGGGGGGGIKTGAGMAGGING